ncbi:MAG: hypothetical protein R6U17_09335 [Thermoplasmata archaeon]
MASPNIFICSHHVGDKTRLISSMMAIHTLRGSYSGKWNIQDYTGIETLLAESVKRDLVLNEKFGIKTQDTLPDRFTKEPLKNGPTKGSVVNIEKMVEEYRRLHDLRNV